MGTLMNQIAVDGMTAVREPGIPARRRHAMEVLTTLLGLGGLLSAGRLWSYGMGEVYDGHVLIAGPWQSTRLGWWLGMPVAVFFTTLFAMSVLVLIFRRLSSARRAATDGCLWILATGLAGSAAWYLAAATAGSIRFATVNFPVIALAAVFAWSVWCHPGIVVSPRQRLRWGGLGLLLTALLPIGQMTPATTAMTEAREVGQYYIGEGASRFIRPFNGAVKLPVNGMPLLGRPDAPYIVLSFFDYTHDESRGTQRALLALRQRFGDQVTIMLAMYPLDGASNRKITPLIAPANPDSGHYAKLALAVWLADPGAFGAFHESLVQAEKRQDMPTLDQARIRAVELIGQDRLDRALVDPRINKLLALGVDAKPRRLAMGRRDESGQIPDLRPCTMWKSLAKGDPGVVAVGELSPKSFLREFEKDTAALPAPGTDKQGPSLMELLE